MTWAFTDLSWSAVLAGWPDMFLSVHDLCDLAETRIMSAEGEALVPLSDLAGLSDDEHRTVAEGLLTRLAELEGRPAFFARREWQAYWLDWHLTRLHERADLPGSLDPYWQIRELENGWENIGKPLDLPPLSPLLRSWVEEADAFASVPSTVSDLRNWVDGQRQLTGVVTALLAAGQRAQVEALAQIFEVSLDNAQAHVQLARDEVSVYQRLWPQELDAALRVEMNRYNAQVLLARRKRGEGTIGDSAGTD